MTNISIFLYLYYFKCDSKEGFKMANFIRTMACSILFFSAAAIADEAFEKSKMIGELDSIKNIFEFQYAPLAWKKNHFGWDLEQEIEKSTQQIIDADQISVKDFQKIVRNFFNSLHDYHTEVLFFSTESAFLPLEIKGTNGRYFITHVDRDLLSPRQYPFHEGDEVVKFNGRPIIEVVDELQQDEFGTVNPGTERALAERLLTKRSGMAGHDVPRGPISLEIRHLGKASTNNYQLIWSYQPEKVSQHSDKILASTPKESQISSKDKIQHFNKPWMTPYYKPFENELLNQILNQGVEDEDEDSIESPFTIGGKNSFVPQLGRIWWSNNKPLWKAYIFETANHQLIGYLRIPLYIWRKPSGFEELKNIIALFEERTDAMIIDQVNNPGGTAFHMYAVAALLTNQALSTPKHCMAITHEDIYHAVETIPELEKVDSDLAAEELLGSNFCGYPISYQFVRHWLEFCRFIDEQWKAGKRLTDPYHLYGVDHINPNPDVNYTKPILVLINELDFSCGDFLPAILQDNKRATLMGSQTSGSGGYVLRNSFCSRYGIAGFSITGSIAHRADHQPIENLGVLPDIPYELTENDFQDGFQDYKKAVLKAIDNLLKVRT